MKVRWRDGVCSIGNTVVGVIQTNGRRVWLAFGCLDEWEDTRIGTEFKTEQQAKKAVERWVEENSEAAK